MNRLTRFPSTGKTAQMESGYLIKWPCAGGRDRYKVYRRKGGKTGKDNELKKPLRRNRTVCIEREKKEILSAAMSKKSLNEEKMFKEVV